MFHKIKTVSQTYHIVYSLMIKCMKSKQKKSGTHNIYKIKQLSNFVVAKKIFFLNESSCICWRKVSKCKHPPVNLFCRKARLDFELTDVKSKFYVFTC